MRARPLPQGPVPIDTGSAELRVEPGGRVTVVINGVPSSFLDLGDPTWLEFEYMQQMAQVIAELPAGGLQAVHLGAGACTMARWLAAVRPGSTQLAVDVDARLLSLVREWFELPRSPQLRLRVGDAREVLASRPADSADLIVRDVFAPDTTPPALTTSQFAAEVARVLRPGGLYLANCADRPPLRQARSEVATVASVFADVALIAEPGQYRGRRHGNLVIAAGSAAVRRPSLVRALRCLPMPARLLTGSELRRFHSGAPVLQDGNGRK